MKTVELAFVHAFEEKGLGKAPFEFENVFDNGGKMNLTTCDFCGNGIRYEYWIKSSDGHSHKVGCDCISKSDDRGLIDVVKRAKARLREEQRHARLIAEQAEQNKLRQIELESQRQRNGGMTDEEVRAAAAAEAVARVRSANQWLIDLLSPHACGSGFVQSMIEELKRYPLSSFTYRQQSVMCDIVARESGRRNSKKYEAACDEFWAKVDEVQA